MSGSITCVYGSASDLLRSMRDFGTVVIAKVPKDAIITYAITQKELLEAELRGDDQVLLCEYQIGDGPTIEFSIKGEGP